MTSGPASSFWTKPGLTPSLLLSSRDLPEHLGRFRIISELGRGGFGVVFLAEDPKLGRKLALKVPRVEVFAHGEAWRCFLREARAASRLDHPNLVPVLETGEIGAVGYIASVYVEGPSLETWLARRTEPMAPRHAAHLVATLARAIEHAHQRGILHRDLKPANVLLQEPEKNGTNVSTSSASMSFPFIPRICDFGLAKLLEAEADESRSMVIAGSPSYMAPEQAQGCKEDLGPGTDVYGLGAILYELLTGRPPFRDKSSLETLRRVIADEPVPPRRIRPEVPRDLETIGLYCLAKRPERRYSTAAALADDLERFLEGRTIEARPAPGWERVWKWSRRRPALAALVLMAILAAAAGSVGLVFLGRFNATLARELIKEQGLVATYRIRQAQQSFATNDLEQTRELLKEAAPVEGSAGAGGFAWNYLHTQLQDRIQVLEGHEAPVIRLRASPDGRTLASGDERGKPSPLGHADGRGPHTGAVASRTGDRHQFQSRWPHPGLDGSGGPRRGVSLGRRDGEVPGPSHACGAEDSGRLVHARWGADHRPQHGAAQPPAPASVLGPRRARQGLPDSGSSPTA